MLQARGESPADPFAEVAPPMLLPAVVIEPTEPHTASLIWLHGLGASGHDFEPIVPLLRMPWARFVFPHAPDQAVTINGGMVMPSWYDIRHFNWDDSGREDEAQVRASAARVDALIAHEAKTVPSSRIVLAGFSQGGALALYVGNRYPSTLAGMLILSAYLLPGATDVSDANTATPTLFLHGRYDDVVPFVAGQRAHAATQSPQRTVGWRDYPCGHEVVPDEIRDVTRFLHERLPRS